MAAGRRGRTGRRRPDSAAPRDCWTRGHHPKMRDRDGWDPARWAMANDTLPFEVVGLLSAHAFPYVKDADGSEP